MKRTHIHFSTTKVFDLFYIKKIYMAVFLVKITHQFPIPSCLPIIIVQLSRNNHTFSTRLQYLTSYLLINYERFVALRKIRN